MGRTSPAFCKGCGGEFLLDPATNLSRKLAKQFIGRRTETGVNEEGQAFMTVDGVKYLVGRCDYFGEVYSHYTDEPIESYLEDYFQGARIIDGVFYFIDSMTDG